MAVSPTLSRRPAPLSGRRILVVEDEYFLADDISRALRSAGAEIAGPVSELDEAIPIINDGGILDGAVLDVNIHSEMVFPVAQELKARQVPFVFTTGYDKVSIAPQFHDVMLWEKPIDIAAMVRGLAGLIGKPKT
ncbi:response regulator [Bradyrhizobium huanghuaihaiense]|uniref:response regulator n=1 Tax=Bradyrhizobium huanghuaihaiense TaxID=990078 RepID=UPI0021A9ED34|nr:response regulator [Bradyrhizobium sp. CB3035]UWU80866.1 response regulator [Bradyrhizobium sp. CB3035]